jgi:Dolichyl-phosphate-mannose-protein mannosyltransferase
MRSAHPFSSAVSSIGTLANRRSQSRTKAEFEARILGILLNPQLLNGLVLLGVGLRFWEYLFNRSLYLDEILLTRSIVGMPLGSLLSKPLLMDQVAPRGFLLVERLVVTILGPSELALRLFPFLCGVASVILFRRLAGRVLTGAGPALALFLFAISVPLIRYGGDVKQYAVDIAAAIGLLLLALDLREKEATTKRLLLAGALGLAVVWFSQTAVLVMAGIGLGLAVDWLISRDLRAGREVLIVIPLWAVAPVAAVIAGMRSMTPSTREFMDDFWAGGFFPRTLRVAEAPGWFWERLSSIFSDPSLLRYRWPVVFLIVAVAGVVALWQRSRPAALLLVGPFVVTMAAAVAHQYPFRGRLIVWLVPSALIAAAAGAEWIRGRTSALRSIAGAALGAALMLAFLASPVMAMWEMPPPYDIEHWRALLSYLQSHRQTGDEVYVLPLQRIGMSFYGPSYGLQPQDWTTGVCSRDDSRAYIRDVDRYRGVRRLWVLSGSSRPFRFVRASVQQYLNTIGVRQDSVEFPSLTMTAVSLELYDLSDTARLQMASAESFPVPPMPNDPRPGCRDWLKP